ncbi:MAG TPA: hypothetical protein VD969_01765 [Symbiobacteriaceae bacterium]|nr:hypothetical protein [Symbiobacteriaceae bacterium]
MSEKKSVQLRKDDVRVDDKGNLVIANPELTKMIKSEKVTEINEVDAHRVTISWE